MISDDVLTICRLGEDSTRQFKADVKNADGLASEMAAFANSNGGTILIGVDDDGVVRGLNQKDVSRINQLISNAASQHVRSPLAVATENVLMDHGKLVIVLTVPKGLDKPYFDKNGVIWLKCGADKRRVNSKEELRRLFQLSEQFHADELPTKAGPDKLDKLRFRDFLRDTGNQDFPDSPSELIRLLQNMNLAADNGHLNLAGILLFAEKPELIKPQFVVKAIRYPGNEIHATDYLDTEDFSGPLEKQFEDSLAFVMRNLHKIQGGRGVNSPGLPEIPGPVFEELIVNALVHRDYLVSAPIRLFIFDDRIEIISPGHLPNNLTVEKIRSGNSNIRNPILVSFAAKGLLPYHGLGSGIKRALSQWDRIEFTDDRDGCLFIATVYRKQTKTIPDSIESSGNNSVKSSVKNSGKSSGRTEMLIIQLIMGNSRITIPEMASQLNLSTRAIDKNLLKLKKSGTIIRSGGRKDGYWEIKGDNSHGLHPIESSGNNSAKSSVKNSGKSSGRTEMLIIQLIVENSRITIPEMAGQLNLSTRAVEKHLLKLRKSGTIIRSGGRKDGHWEFKGGNSHDP